MKRLTSEEFIRRAHAVHGEKYDYSRVEYQSAHKKVEIICPLHGSFWQSPVNHTRRGDGCPICGYGIDRQSWHRTTANFIDDAKKVHGNKYEYDKSIYVSNEIKLTITCPIHGDFLQTPASHLYGKGCPKCSGREVRTTTDFINKANIIHRCKYDYSLAEYTKTSQKICIICPEHGEFWQTPNSHLAGQGCPRCKTEKMKGLVFGVGVNDSTPQSNRKIIN